MSTKKEILKENLETILKNYNEDGFLCVIKGKWGIGKTYFIKSFVEEFKKDRKYKDNYAYISLFNKVSIYDIEKEIIVNLYKSSKFIKSIKDKIEGLKFNFGIRDKDNDFIFNSGTFGTLINLGISFFEKKDFKDVIIIFDDLERIGDNLNLDVLLGFFSVLKEEKKCRIILIFNEEELKDKDKEIYEKYKEKIVDFEFTYDPNVEENFSILEEKFKDFCFNNYKDIKDFLVFYNINNIRIMIQIFSVLDRLCQSIRGIENLEKYRDLLQEAIKYLIPFVYLKKVKNILPQDVLEKRGYYLGYLFSKNLNNNETEEKDSQVKEIEEIFHYFSHFSQLDLFIPKYIKAFFPFIEKELLTPELIANIKDALENELNIRRNQNIKEEFENKINKYLYNFKYEDKDFIKDLRKLFNKHKSKILEIFYLDDLYSILRYILSEVDQQNKDTYLECFSEILVSYLNELYKKDKEEFQILLYKYMYERMDILREIPSLKEKLENLEQEFKNNMLSSCDSVKDLIKGILEGSILRSKALNLNDIKESFIRDCLLEDEEFTMLILRFIKSEKSVRDSIFNPLIKKVESLLNSLEKDIKIKGKIKLIKAKYFSKA